MTRLLAALFAVLVVVNADAIYGIATRELPGPEQGMSTARTTPVLPPQGQAAARVLIRVVVK